MEAATAREWMASLALSLAQAVCVQLLVTAEQSSRSTKVDDIAKTDAQS